MIEALTADLCCILLAIRQPAVREGSHESSPLQNVRIIEKSATLTGRLIGLLFADQGADVFVERGVATTLSEHDGYLDRGKVGVPPGVLADTTSADVIIVDGAVPVSRAAAQIVVRVTAAVPGGRHLRSLGCGL